MSLLLNAVYTSALVILLPWLLVRSLITGRYRRGMSAKIFGLAHSPCEPGKDVAWFHGVSVGEIHLLGVVVAAYRKRFPDRQVVISSTTDTGLAEAKKRFPDLPIIPWPFDFSWAVRRTLRAVAPRLIVLAESELWPNFLRAAKRAGVPVVVINGRISPRSFARMQRFARVVRPLLLEPITRFAVQSSDYAQRLEALGVAANKVIVTGSVKYDNAHSDRENPKTRGLRDLLGIKSNDLVWLAGSTHAPEERIVLNVFRKLRLKHPRLRLVLAPRSPDRFEEVARLIDRNAFSWVRRSALQRPPSDEPAVLLLDTLGELGAAWGLADIAFTGGSLDGKRGGQSMIEPAGYGMPIVFGPHVWNFRDAARRLIEVGAARQVQGEESLLAALSDFLADPALRERMAVIAREFVIAQQGATERTIDVLAAVWPAAPTQRNAA